MTCLLNSRVENVWFYNCIMQVLYSLPHFQNFVQQSFSMDSVIVSTKALFEELLNPTGSVMTPNYVFSFNYIEYRIDYQYDVDECLF